MENACYIIEVKTKGFKFIGSKEHDECNHTNTNALDTIRTPQLNVLGRE